MLSAFFSELQLSWLVVVGATSRPHGWLCGVRGLCQTLISVRLWYWSCYRGHALFLLSDPDLAMRENTFHALKLLCLRLGHIVKKLPQVKFGSSWIGIVKVDLSCVIEPLQEYLLSLSRFRKNFFTDLDSIGVSRKLLWLGITDRLQSPEPRVFSWVWENILWLCKAVRNASDVGSSSSVSDPVFVPKKFPYSVVAPQNGLG